MSKAIKFGKFSNKYNYIRCEDGEYFLVPKSKISDPSVLYNKNIPSIKIKSDGDIKFFEFAITPVKLLIYIGICAILSMWLVNISVYLVVLLWSMNLHEFTHMAVAAFTGSDRLIFGCKIKYVIFLCFIYLIKRYMNEQRFSVFAIMRQE